MIWPLPFNRSISLILVFALSLIEWIGKAKMGMSQGCDMATVLITGGAGFIGRHVARHFLSKKWEVRLFDLQEIDPKDPLCLAGCDCFTGDVRSMNALRPIMQGCDVVVHLAAVVSVPQSILEPEKTMDVNVDGTRIVLQCAHEMNVNNTIVASSAAVYGDSAKLPLIESHPTQSLSPYGESKIANEQDVIRFRNEGLNAIALRFFNVYGPGQNTRSSYASLIPIFVKTMISGKQPTIYGDGAQSRDFIHVYDLSRAIFMLSTKCDGYVHAVANIATQTQTSVLEVYEIINQELSKHNQSHLAGPLYADERKGDIRHSFGSNSRLQNMTGWQPSIKFENGIASLIEGYKEMDSK